MDSWDSTPAQPVFVTGRYADRSGAQVYLHLVRAPDDPERSPRPRGGQPDRAPHRTLAKRKAADWEPVLLEALADGQARTFNRIGVELFDLTADVLCTTPVDEALWNLVHRGLLEHTLQIPILFRLRQGVEDLAQIEFPSVVPQQLELF